ncbi:hypothetical protein O6H91_07G132700 [Diphasiastrum complanatum]|uniref:Uncharacterized protein n=1 Tax=Diphasiastrum complanatum TaxID=34168 RepID=A0ACC2D9N9_DIPCM|nr:hypothetical protein O6H91_07G132700 [Diphasiastrum complanatum]
MGHEMGPTSHLDLSQVHVSLKDPIMVFADTSTVPALDHPAKISLSALDRQAPFYMYMLLFFNNRVHRGSGTVFKELKTALQQVLVPYFPLSGRLRKDCDTGYVGVECTNEGVLLVEAATEDELNFLDDFKLFDSHIEDKFLYKLEPTPDNPLLTVQITRFPSGGFVLGLGWRHEIHDGFGINSFLSAWADVTRGEPLSSIPQPCHGRELLQPMKGLTNSSAWQQKLRERFLGIPLYTFSQEKQARDWAVTDTETFTSSPLYITKIFAITNPIIASLKKKAMEGGFLTSCSTFDVVIAHAWLARVKATEMQADERALLEFAVNGRSKTEPPLPQNFCGNAFVMASQNCNVRELLHSSFPEIVQRIQKAKESIKHEYILDTLLFLDDSCVKALTSYREATLVTDWTKFTLDRLDFGWGKTSFVTPAALPLLDVVCALRTGLEDGGVSLRLGLLPHIMAKFEEHLFHV